VTDDDRDALAPVVDLSEWRRARERDDDDLEDDDELEDDVPDPNPVEDEDEDLELTDPLGLHALAASCGGDRHLVYGIYGSKAVFASASLAAAIIDALPDTDDYDWCDVVPWVEAAMSSLLPEAVLERHARVARTALDGDLHEIAADVADAVTEELRALGYECRRDDDTIARACGWKA